jgi:hypothetical protein
MSRTGCGRPLIEREHDAWCLYLHDVETRIHKAEGHGNGCMQNPRHALPDLEYGTEHIEVPVLEHAQLRTYKGHKKFLEEPLVRRYDRIIDPETRRQKIPGLLLERGDFRA